MYILSGKLKKREMFRYFGGAETLSGIDKSLARLADMGYLKYNKLKGGIYDFILYPEPVKELELTNGKR